MTSKEPLVSFFPNRGSGLLTLFWKKECVGLGTPPLQGFGVGFFDTEGELLGVEFFDVDEKADEQTLKFKDISILIRIKNGKLTNYEIKNKNAA